jgi:hypothetical protein
MSDSAASPFVGPSSITVARTAPFWPAADISLTLSELALVNTGTSPAQITRIACDPLVERETGMATMQTLSALPTAETVPPGDTVRVELRGHIPAGPGAYISTVRIRAGEDQPALSIPLSVTVAASTWRGLLCTLLGLVVAALLFFLQSEGDLHARRADLLQARADTEDWRRRNAVPSSLAAAWDAYDADVQSALRYLGERHPLGVIDNRALLADDRRHAAENELKTIKEAMKDAPPGAAEVRELDAAWSNLQNRFKGLEERPEALPGAVAGSLGGRLDSFLDTFRAEYIGLPVQDVKRQLGTYVAIADLTLAAGQPEAARQQALEARRVVEAAARDINQRLITLANFEDLARSLSAEDASVRMRLADASIPEDTRRILLEGLDATSATIRPELGLPGFAQAYAQLLESGTALLRVRAQVLVQQVQDAVAREAAATDNAAVREAMTTDAPDPHAPAEQRAAFLGRVLVAWRAVIGTVPDPPVRQDLLARVDAVSEPLGKGDLKATLLPYKALTQAWTDYGLRRIQDGATAAEAPFCLAFGVDLRRALSETEANMRLIPAHPDRPVWEAAVNRIRLGASAVPDSDCLAVKLQRKGDSFDIEQKPVSPLFELRDQANALAQTVFTGALNATPLPAAARLQAAEMSGVEQAIALTRSLMTKSRVLTVTPTPPRLIAGQAVRFDVGNLDPDWGRGVRLAIDFGDRSPPEQLDADEVRKSGFVHTYDTPLRGGSLQVVAASGFRAESIEPTDKVLGDGSLTLSVADSPIRLARALSDALLNLRFALALAISLLVYLWQFRMKEQTFGRSGFDYVRAFALGFAVEAAAWNLPEALNKLAGG